MSASVGADAGVEAPDTGVLAPLDPAEVLDEAEASRARAMNQLFLSLLTAFFLCEVTGGEESLDLVEVDA